MATECVSEHDTPVSFCQHTITKSLARNLPVALAQASSDFVQYSMGGGSIVVAQ